jgi:hypothetical protein
VKDYGGVPPYEETQNYVVHVLGYYTALAGGGEEASDVLASAELGPTPVNATNEVATSGESANADETFISVVITPKVEILVLPPPPLLIAKQEPSRSTTLGLESQSGLTLYRRPSTED